MAKKTTQAQATIPHDHAEKRKMADLIISQLKSNFGSGAIMKMNEIAEDVEVISTGSLSVDLATGIGGLAKGRIIEIYGPEAS